MFKLTMMKPPKMNKLATTRSEEKKEQAISKSVDMDDTYDIRPSIHLTEAQLPQIKDWKIGGKYKVMLELEQKSGRMDGGKMSAEFKIVSIGHMADEKPIKK